MAIDTVKIVSPSLSAEMVAAVEQLHRSKRRQTISTGYGEIEQEFTTANLKGSHDSDISMAVKWDKLEYDNEQKKQVKITCEPYLTVECSVHKAMAGHNVYGGSDNFVACCRWLVDYISDAIGVQLPTADDWIVRKVDMAEVFHLQSVEACMDWFKGLQVGEYYRKRPIHRYGGHGIEVGGHTTCLKFYHKGTEFKEHDAKRLRKVLSVQQLKELQDIADKLVRVEVSIKAPKLDYDFKKPPLVSEITEDYLYRVYDKEIGSFLRVGVTGVNTVRNYESVKRYLAERYGQRLGKNLFHTWLELAACGETIVKAGMKQTTFYEHIRYLKQAGCSWHGTDVFRNSNLVPSDFTPVRQDERRLITEWQGITDKLNLFRNEGKEKPQHTA
ncbi:phage/plasmid replication protein, II/X family [Brevibacillus invocatus]|nr:phage/plasmid replication protein, II/X family [Brevibacillus invocatus]